MSLGSLRFFSSFCHYQEKFLASFETLVPVQFRYTGFLDSLFSVSRLSQVVCGTRRCLLAPWVTGLQWMLYWWQVSGSTAHVTVALLAPIHTLEHETATNRKYIFQVFGHDPTGNRSQPTEPLSLLVLVSQNPNNHFFPFALYSHFLSKIFFEWKEHLRQRVFASDPKDERKLSSCYFKYNLVVKLIVPAKQIFQLLSIG